MDKLFDNVKKELKEIEEKGLTEGNLDCAAKLVQMYHHLAEEERDGVSENYLRYMGPYDKPGYWPDTRYPQRGRVYYGNNPIRERANKVMDGAESYVMGRDRYREGGSEQRIYDGLDKMMYSICTLVESAMDFAETPEEKEIIRRHVLKLQGI